MTNQDEEIRDLREELANEKGISAELDAKVTELEDLLKQIRVIIATTSHTDIPQIKIVEVYELVKDYE